MNSRDYVLTKMIAWAQDKGIDLTGSAGDRGAEVYTTTIDDNLFEPLSPEARASFEDGNGGELGTADKPGKMQALHSSSALGANVFQYWQQNGDVATIAAACGLCTKRSDAPESIVFEDKYPISSQFSIPPNIDVVIHNKEGSHIQRLAVECKFTEAYGGYEHGGVDPKYLEGHDDLWADIPHLKEFAESISPNDSEFKYLHPAQLVKHILGLKNACGHSGFRLLYLWYDVLGEAGAQHHAEVERFAKVAKSDGIMFHSLTYQELIVRLAKSLGAEHRDYAQYLATRYL